MSTKMSIKYKDRTPNTPGYHLYRDVLDAFRGDGESTPVYLELEAVRAEMATMDQGAKVTVELPEETARELGLLPSKP